MSLLSRLQEALQPVSQPSATQPDDDALQIAAAVLLLEMERADYQHNEAERDAVLHALRDHFRLSEAEAQSLIKEACQEAQQAVSLHDYVTVINDTLTAADKLHILRMLWQIAYADGELHHYEEHLLRQLADLLHIPHHDYIRVKLQVSGEL
ncbi:MAG: TerB family tellurite resistance protein [Salinisphaeraceae bacterium]|nr:TerB family tellurite resistance protein [Salinisphaeraceae bacterium]